jgi:hypothetical protein
LVVVFFSGIEEELELEGEDGDGGVFGGSPPPYPLP